MWRLPQRRKPAWGGPKLFFLFEAPVVATDNGATYVWWEEQIHTYILRPPAIEDFAFCFLHLPSITTYKRIFGRSVSSESDIKLCLLISRLALETGN
jgi:hypothetical protein